MRGLQPTAAPSSSGARLTGDDVQHLIAWYWCLKALSPQSRILSVSVEAAQVGNVDDITVEFGDGTSKYIQVKATVSARNVANMDWLTARPKPSPRTGNQAPSLLQKLHASWEAVGCPGEGVELITGRPLDPADELLRSLDRNNVVGPSLRRATKAALVSIRAELAEHLDRGESDVCDFLSALAIRVGQTESEWRSRVADVAMGAGIRADDVAIAAGIGWIREWVKDTRDPRSSVWIASEVSALGLRVEAPRSLVVFQGIDMVSSDGATSIVEWTKRFRGDEPSKRRGLIDPEDWNGAMTQDLSELRAALLGRGDLRILLRGALRLPCWFAVGAALRSVAGFSIAMDYRAELWAGDLAKVGPREVVVMRDEHFGDGRTALVVAISTDQTADVRAGLVDERHGRLITLSVGDGPLPSLLTGPDDAMSAAVAIRDWVRSNIRRTEIDLVLMAPAPFAAFLGHCWDRIAPTTIHEDLVDGYEVAFRLSNTAP